MDSIRSARCRNSVVRSFPLLGIFSRVWSSRGPWFDSVVPPQADVDFRAASFSPKINREMCVLGRGVAPLEARNRFSELMEVVVGDGVSVFTDGAKAADPSIMVGAGIFIPHLGATIMHRLPSETTVFSAEAWAMLQALFVIKDKNWRRATIFTDSLSVVEAMSGGKGSLKNHLICNIKKQLYGLHKEGREICVCWVPAHKGIPGNERADEAARMAITMGDYTDFRVPYTDLFAEATARIEKKQREANIDTFSRRGNLYYEKCWLDSGKPWFHRKAIDRGGIVIMNRIRSNHYNLLASLYRKNMVDSPDCPCGTGQQDINHTVFYCPDTIPKSGALRKYIKDTFPNAPINFFDIIRNPEAKLCRLLAAYLKSCEISV